MTRDSTGSHIVLAAIDLTGVEEPICTKTDLPDGSRFAYDMIVVSPDSGRLYLGFGDQVSGFDTISEVRTFDTATLEELAKLDLGGSAVDLAISSEGDHLYVLSAVSQTLAVYDAISLAPLGAPWRRGEPGRHPRPYPCASRPLIGSPPNIIPPVPRETAISRRLVPPRVRQLFPATEKRGPVDTAILLLLPSNRGMEEWVGGAH